MIKEISIFYFHGGVPHGYDCPLKHKQVIPYTKNNLHNTIDTVMDSGLNVLVYRPNPDCETVTIMIDNKRFQQR